MAYSTVKWYITGLVADTVDEPSSWNGTGASLSFASQDQGSFLNETVGATNQIYGACWARESYPHDASWSGSNTLTVQMNLNTTDSGAEARWRVSRVNASGTIQQSGSWTSYQTLAANRTYSVTQPSWTSGAATDYFALEVEFQRVSGQHGNKNTQLDNSSYISNLDIIPDSAEATKWTQKDFRFRDDDGSETAATWRQSINVDDTLDTDTNYRIRFNLEITDVQAFPSVLCNTFKLEYNKNSTGWHDVTSSSSNVRLATSTNFADEDRTTQQLGTGPGSFIIGRLIESQDFYMTVQSLVSTTYETEFEFCFQVRSADVSGGDTIDLRMVGFGQQADASGALDMGALTGDTVDVDGEEFCPLATDVNTFTNTPTITVSSSGTTYFETPSMTATGTVTLTVQAQKSLSYSGTGTNSITKDISTSKSFSGSGSSSITKQAQLPKSMTATGTSALTTALAFFKTLASTAVGTASIVKQAQLTKAITAVGSSTISKAVSVSKALTAVGTSAITKLVEVTKSFSGIGTATLSVSKVVMKTLSYAATGTASIIKQAQLTKAITAIGSSTLSTALTYIKVLSSTATGTLSLVKQVQLTKGITAVGTATLNATRVVLKTLAYAATGTASILKQVNISRAFSGIGTNTLVKLVQLTKTITATGASSLQTSVAFLKTLTYTAVGTASSTLATTFRRTLTYTGIGTASVTIASTFLKTLSYVAIGTTTITKQVLKAFAATATGAVSLTKLTLKALTITALGTAYAEQAFVILKSMSYFALGTASLIKQVQVVKSISAFGSATISKFITLTAKVANALGSCVNAVAGIFNVSSSSSAIGTANLSTQTTIIVLTVGITIDMDEKMTGTITTPIERYTI